MKNKLLLSCLAVLFAAVSFAQPKPVLADKIVGVVGNKIVLKSDIDNSLLDMQRQGMEVPENGSCMVLEQALGVKALVLQAEKDSLPVTDEDVESELDNRIRYFMQQYGSKDELERIAGKSVYQIKDDMRDGIRDMKMAQAMRDKIVGEVRITPNEVKAFFENIPTDSLPFYETEVEVGQIISYPKATREAEEYAIEQLKDYKKQIEAGKDFRSLAAAYSEDPGSKDVGGQYEVNRTAGLMDPTWIAKAFALKEGQVSNPFKTQFGYHIIQMVSRAGDDAVVRHILKVPQVTTHEMQAGFSKLDSVRANLIAGTIDFGTAVNKYSDDPGAKFTAGRLQGPNGGFLTMDQIDPSMLAVIKNLKVGEYSQPTEFADERGKKGIRIVYLISQSQPHRENLKDDYSKIANRALEEKKENALEEWFYKKIKTYYVMIDKDYQTCPEIAKWVDASKISDTGKK
ncbi:MAG TPA: peptidylprolyl isomerase [Ferruginibacter sp.]|nr:peptidylprolyl isomerase [Ferruginibacter sp.]HRE63725.1 peptidylprolyl isomerase [Ferruginibacter sp.]